ncbi:MAG: O-antigen ligase family protein [Flavobacterium sp.]|nr:O-antigen ligase family protein [Flavobacterium sp.]
MAVTINKPLFNQILFIICVIVPFFNIYEFSFLFWLFAITVTLKNNYSVEFVKFISLFIAVFFTAIVVGLFFQHNFYFVIRDITYLLKPISGLLLGYQLFNKGIKKPFKFLVLAGVSIACYHLILVFSGIIFHGANSVAVIREYGGYFNDFEVYALIILVFEKQLDLNFIRRKQVLFLFILSLSSFFYLARTNFIQFVILFMSLKGLLVFNKRALIVITSVLVFSISGYTAIYYYNPSRSGKAFDEFLYKIKMAPGEAFSTKINRDDWKDFNDNYRSYENIRTIEQLSHNNSLFFGEGVGSQVDLRQKVHLGDMELRYISILHNGFMIVILKTGFFGLSIYLFTIFYFFKKNKYSNAILKNINFLFVGTGVFLIVSNWVFLGFYNLLDTKSLLIGFLFAYKNEIIKTIKND